jgi:hypothetical protein
VKTSAAQFLVQFVETIWRTPIKLMLLTILFGTSIGSAAVGDVGVYTSPLKSFSTASYWIEGARGVIGGIDLVESQATYLKLVRKTVREVLAPGELGWIRKLWLQRKIEAAYPQLGYALFMRDGLPAVWINEQATKQ